MSLHNLLVKAKLNKKDEFYSQLKDIEIELAGYSAKQFKNKVVYCNCDNPFYSNFFKYFLLNFKRLGLKGLIATSYGDSENQVKGNGLNCDELSKYSNQAIKVHFKALKSYPCNIEDVTPDFILQAIKDNPENSLTTLSGNGDFRCEECVEILQEADIVVTNPPFSLFRDFINLMMTYNKKFLVLGHINAVKYTSIFPYIVNNQIWLGHSIKSGDREFRIPDCYPISEKTRARVDEWGNKYVRVTGVRWFTNLNYEQEKPKLELLSTYSDSKYPEYDYYNAINVNKVVDIPKDYKGLIGVPITFLDKYNKEQFEIIDCIGANAKLNVACKSQNQKSKLPMAMIHGKRLYERLIIRHR